MSISACAPGDPYLERYRVMQLGNMDLSLYGFGRTTSGDSTDSLPETSSSAEPRETEHIASVHKSGSPVSSKESTTSEWGSSEDFPDIDSSKVGQEAEPEQKLGQGAESEQKQGQGVESGVKLNQEAESVFYIKVPYLDAKVGQEIGVKLGQGAESEEVPLAEEEDTVDFRDMDDKNDNCDTLKEDSVENTQEEIRKEVTVETQSCVVSNSKEEQESKGMKEKEEVKKIKEDKKSKPSSSSSSSSPSPPLIYAPLDNKDDVILVQKPLKKTSEDGSKVKSIVSQYSCLGGKSREEEEYDNDAHVGIPALSVSLSDESGKKSATLGTTGMGTGTTTTTAAVVGKLMIRSASYDVAIREVESNSVSVRQMVKRYSQGTSS